MLNIGLIKKYAKAALELAQEEKQLLVYDEQLAKIAVLFRDNPNLVAFLDNPQIKPADKTVVMKKIIGEDYLPSISNFIYLLIDKKRISLLSEIIEEFHALANEARNIETVHITTAFPLSEEQITSLTQKIENLLCKKLQLNIKVDNTIVGGIVMKIGDRLIDGSIISRLKSIRNELMANY